MKLLIFSLFAIFGNAGVGAFNNQSIEVSSSFTSLYNFFKPFPSTNNSRRSFYRSGFLVLNDQDDDNICNDDFSQIPSDQRCNCSTQVSVESYINWPEFHYCTMANYSGLSIIVLLFALVFLFVLLATTTDDHLVPALEKVTEFLKLSPNIAGVTLLAFGNGAADVFTSFSAITSGSSSDIGLGAIVGAGMFITTMVLSFIIIPVGEFSTVRRPFIRDIIFFLIPTIFLYITYRNGELTFFGSLTLLIFYFFYVVVVIGGRYLNKKWKAKNTGLDQQLINPVEDTTAVLRAPLLIQNEEVVQAHRLQNEAVLSPTLVLQRDPSLLNEYNSYATKAAHLRALSRRPDSQTPGPTVTSNFQTSLLAPPSLLTRGRVHSRSVKSMSHSRSNSPGAGFGTPDLHDELVNNSRDYRSKSISFPPQGEVVTSPYGREHRSKSIDPSGDQSDQIVVVPIERRRGGGGSHNNLSAKNTSTKPFRSTSINDPDHREDESGDTEPFSPNDEEQKKEEVKEEAGPAPWYMKIYNVTALVFGWLFWIAGAPFVIGRTLTIPDLGLEEDEDDKKKDEEHHATHNSQNHVNSSPQDPTKTQPHAQEDIDVVNPTFLSLSFVAAPVLLSLIISETEFGIYFALIFGSVAALWMYQKLPQFSVDRKDGAAEHGEMEVVFPRHYKLLLLLLAFFMSMVWIYLIANELVAVLALIGVIIGMSQGIMGLTILAWGNSIGDLVADYLLAKGGNPRMAAAGCFGGPAFNMMVGLGLGFTFLNAKNYPTAYVYEQTNSMNLAFYFLMGTLVATLIVVPLCKFHFRRNYAFVLVGGYVIYTIMSILLELNVL